ncbi:pyruvoyl-dependent arginine decarboxylase [Psychroserpens sp.]
MSNSIYNDMTLSDGILLGNRVPKDFFITSGSGESDICVHAGSYHLALKNAGIEKANILTYSSVLPPIAREVEKKEITNFGSVVETIMAIANGSNCKRLSAGIKFGWLYHRNSGKKIGGLVSEHGGEYSLKELKSTLSLSLHELYENGFEKEYELKEERIITKTFIPKKKYGTVMVSICFTNYLYPIIDKNKK